MSTTLLQIMPWIVIPIAYISGFIAGYTRGEHKQNKETSNENHLPNS